MNSDPADKMAAFLHVLNNCNSKYKMKKQSILKFINFTSKLG